MRKSMTLIVGAALAAVAMVGCGGSGGSGLVNQPQARARLVNAFPGVPEILARAGEDTFGGTGSNASIPFGSISETVITDNDRKDVTVGDRAANSFNNLATLADQLFELDRYYLLVGFGSDGNRRILKLNESNSGADEGKAAYRLVHAAQSAGAVDIYVTDTTASLPVAPTFPNVAVGNATEYSEIILPGGSLTTAKRIRIYAAGTTATPLVDQNVTFDVRSRFTFVARDPQNTGGTPGLITVRDDR